MRRVLPVVLSCLSLVAVALALTSPPASAQPVGVTRNTVVVTPQAGWDLYNGQLWDYRRSPAVLSLPSNVLSRWDCGPDSLNPSSPEAIRYSTSSDGGHTWSTATVVLRGGPAGTWDAQGVCDPSVVKIGDYYYLAYTGTVGILHQVYLARATNPAGPYTKWTLNGWAPGILQPLANAKLYTAGYGTGGPSLVVSGTTVSLYYGDHDGTNWQTRLRTAEIPAGDPQGWPTMLTDDQTVIGHPGKDPASPCLAGMTDSTDVKYVDSLGLYVAITSDSRTYRQSAIQAYESTDGIHFRKSITPRGDFQSNAQNASLVGNASGHVDGTTPRAVLYSSSDSPCPPRRLHWSPVDLGKSVTGWFSDPLTQDRELFTPGLGRWEYTSDNGYAQTNLYDGNSSRLSSFQVGSSITIDVDYSLTWVPVISDYAGVAFGQVDPEDTYQSGYRVLVWQDGTVQLWKAGTKVASASLIPSYLIAHLQVVQAGTNIKIYVGQTGRMDRLSNPVIEFIDDDAPYLGGYFSLLAGGEAWFKNLTISDNVPGSYQSPDWQPTSGSWTLPAANRLVQSAAGGGQSFLRSGAPTTGNFNAHLGDGTYTATIKLDPGGDPTGWGGLNIANTSTASTLSWGDGGYLVFLRRNGNLGIHKAGSGQIVADIPTGTTPTATPVELRIVKLGANIQVYLDRDELPLVNFTDTGDIPKIGGLGVATQLASGTFTDVTYAADNIAG